VQWLCKSRALSRKSADDSFPADREIPRPFVRQLSFDSTHASLGFITSDPQPEFHRCTILMELTGSR